MAVNIVYQEKVIQLTCSNICTFNILWGGVDKEGGREKETMGEIL